MAAAALSVLGNRDGLPDGAGFILVPFGETLIFLLLEEGAEVDKLVALVLLTLVLVLLLSILITIKILSNKIYI